MKKWAKTKTCPIPLLGFLLGFPALAQSSMATKPIGEYPHLDLDPVCEAKELGQCRIQLLALNEARQYRGSRWSVQWVSCTEKGSVTHWVINNSCWETGRVESAGFVFYGQSVDAATFVEWLSQDVLTGESSIPCESPDTKTPGMCFARGIRCAPSKYYRNAVLQYDPSCTVSFAPTASMELDSAVVKINRPSYIDFSAFIEEFQSRYKTTFPPSQIYQAIGTEITASLTPVEQTGKCECYYLKQVLASRSQRKVSWETVGSDCPWVENVNTCREHTIKIRWAFDDGDREFYRWPRSSDMDICRCDYWGDRSTLREVISNGSVSKPTKAATEPQKKEEPAAEPNALERWINESNDSVKQGGFLRGE